MPSESDDFSERAHPAFKDCQLSLLKNREILEREMVEAGFLALPTEWWHFEDPESSAYPVLDLSFEDLERVIF